MRRGGRGRGWLYLFPSPSDPAKPVSKKLADTWMRTAEVLAGLEPLEGTCWHWVRRKWATERKNGSLRDVAAAGGWKDPRTLLTIYQQPDPETMYEVVTNPRRRKVQ